jgi:hypothetical protein
MIIVKEAASKEESGSTDSEAFDIIGEGQYQYSNGAIYTG